MTQALDNVCVKSVRPWQNKRRIASRPARLPWSERRHKEELGGGGGDVMHTKRKKLGQGVSIKSLKRAHFEVEFKENYNESKSCRTTTERVHSGEVQDNPRHGSESAKGLRRGGKVKGFTIWLQPRKTLR